MNFLSLIILLLFFSCSTTRLTVDLTSNVINKGIDAFYEEDDLELAMYGMQSNIKLLEVLHKAEPNNKKIRIILAQIYAGYTFIFLENQLLETNYDEEVRARLISFYSRGLNYALSVLKEDNNNFKNAYNAKDFNKLSSAIQNINNKDALFWCILNWSLLINNTRTNPDRVSEFPILIKLIDRMIELDASYFYYTPLSLKATINAVLPKMFGGDPVLSKSLFEKAIEKDKNFLLHKLLFAQYLTPNLQDKDLFEYLISSINEFDLDKKPNIKLLNQAVKRKASLIYDYTLDLFIE